MDHLHLYQRRRLNHQQPLHPQFSDVFLHQPPPQQPPHHHHLPPRDFASNDRNQFDFRQIRVQPSQPPLIQDPRFPPRSPVVNRQVIDCFPGYSSHYDPRLLVSDQFDVDSRVPFNYGRISVAGHRDESLQFDRIRAQDDGIYRDLYSPDVNLGGNIHVVDKVGFFRDENMPLNYVNNGNFNVQSEFRGREIDQGRNRVPVVSHGGFGVRSDSLRSPFEFRGGEIEGEGRYYDERGNSRLYVDRDGRERGRNRMGEDYREFYDHEPRRKLPRKPSAFRRLQPANPRFSSRKKLGMTATRRRKGKKNNVESLGRKSNEEKDKKPVDLNVSFKSNGTASSSRVGSDLDSKRVGESPLRTRRLKNRGNNSPVPKKDEKQSDNQNKGSPTLMKVGIRKVAEMPDINSKSSASGSSGLSGEGNVCCKTSLEGTVVSKDDKKDGITNACMASPSSNRKKRKAVNLISRLSASVPTNSDTGADVDNLITIPSCGSLPDEPPKSNIGDDVTICLAKCSSDIAVKTGCGENQGSSEHMAAPLAPTNSVTCGVYTTIKTEDKAYLVRSDVNVYEPLGLLPECDVIGQQCRSVDRDDDDNVAESESCHSGDEKKSVYSPSMNVSNGDFVSTDCMKLTKVSDIEVTNGIQERQCTDTGSTLVKYGARKRRNLSLKACVSKGGNLALPSVKKGGFSPDRKRKAGSDDADPNNYSPNRSQKRKIIKLDSAFTDTSVSKSSDLCAPEIASKSVTSETLSSANYSEETVGGGEVSNSLLRPPEDMMGETTNGLRTEISVLTDSSKEKVKDKDSYSPVTDTPLSSYISASECNRKDDAILIGAEKFVRNELIGSDSEVEMAKRIRNSGVHCVQPSYSADLNGAPLVTDMECESNINLEGDLAALSDCPFLCTEPTLEIVTNKPVMLDKPPRVNSLGVTPQVIPTFVISKPAVHTSDDLNCGDSKRRESLKSLRGLHSKSTFVRPGFEKSVKPENLAAPSNRSFTQKAASVPSQYAKKTLTISSSTSRQFSWTNEQTRGKTTLPSRQPFPVTTFSKKSLPTIPVKPGTWRRVNNLAASNTTAKNPSSSAAPPSKPSYGKNLKVQDTSYVRKGNSLVRNSVTSKTTLSSSASVSLAKQIDVIDNGKLKSSRTTNSIESPDFLITGERRTPVEMPKVHSLPYREKTSDFDIASVGNCTSPLQGEQFDGMDNRVLPKATETSLGVSANPDTVLDLSLSDDGNLSDGVLQTSNVKKVVYVKRKANQLIAAAASPELAGRNMDKNLGLSSDNSYYKRRKHQLIRASSESNIKKMVSAADDSSNSKTQYSGRSASKGPSRRVKSAKVPLVWKLCDAKSSDNCSEPLRSRQLLTHLLPWKRTTLRRSVWRASASSTSRSSPIKIRKQLSSRNQTVLYVRSGRGFSLKRSKVISLAGSLKWSKSMEKRSKKVDEEAGLAVAASDSTARQKTAASGISSEAGIIRKHSSHKSVHGMKLHSGERIFRVGVFRYRMDPSRRTLQRIPDEEAPDSTTSEAECARKPYVPKRLLIGSNEYVDSSFSSLVCKMLLVIYVQEWSCVGQTHHWYILIIPCLDECSFPLGRYVRIGNGHQLVRDPKRRTRILASEKVRWSLHTARLRLAKKRKFCQFFTRFGRCNKSEGKCPYIHDSSKIAVCTKFLKGLCVDANCKLTHEVIPDRMPDCSFFLQGSCSHDNCPYRHVNVNLKAAICESFLRGYCAEGNKCPKKHSYLCPEFEAIGSCPRGSKCKLYHPKKGVSKKGKISEEEEINKVRYFDLAVCKPESETIILEKAVASKAEGGEFGDYISLDVNDDETGESTYPNSKMMHLSEFVEPENMSLDQAGENAYPSTEVMYLSEFDVLCSSYDTDEITKE